MIKLELVANTSLHLVYAQCFLFIKTEENRQFRHQTCPSLTDSKKRLSFINTVPSNTKNGKW